MGFLEFIWVPLILVLVIVAPVWIIAHYVTTWRTSKTLSGEDENMLQQLWEDASRMEDRIKTLERILDADAPGWRKEP